MVTAFQFQFQPHAFTRSQLAGEAPEPKSLRLFESPPVGMSLLPRLRLCAFASFCLYDRESCVTTVVVTLVIPMPPETVVTDVTVAVVAVVTNVTLEPCCLLM